MSMSLIPRKLAILSFHKIGLPPPQGWETWSYISEESFVGHLTYLQNNRWHVIDVVTFLKGLAWPESLPERAALLTFDDGYRSILDGARRRLLQFSYPAVVFVPTDFIGGRNTFDTGIEPEEVICGWDDLLELERCGVSVQSHGASHRPFSKLTRAEQELEMRRSKRVLEAYLGKHVEVFCYPYGDGGTEPRTVGAALQRAGYRAACLYGGGPVPLPIRDPYRLTRVAMGPDSDLHIELEQE
jgi:peptidoglycan/xylan/chitin deacetylase (PgdA/CDA1 family)